MVMLRIKGQIREARSYYTCNTNLLTLVMNMITTDATNDIRTYSLTNAAVSGSVFIVYCFQCIYFNVILFFLMRVSVVES